MRWSETRLNLMLYVRMAWPWAKKNRRKEGKACLHTPTSVVQGAGPVGGDDRDDNGGKSDKIGEEHVHRLLLPGGGGRKIVAFEDFENIEGKEGEGSDGLRVRYCGYGYVASVNRAVSSAVYVDVALLSEE